MELTKIDCKIRCEMGACKNLATYTIKMSRVGIRSRIHICESCVKELYGEIGRELVPKSIETAKVKADDTKLKGVTFAKK